jgi:demethylmenaquinone methyltransferase/2-methoxy-6-polyprenyl-1,4-benzoquinol methylase
VNNKDQYLFNLKEPVVREAIHTLQLPVGSQGLDVGCGTGYHTVLLAEAVSPGGHVTGLDLSPENIAYAREAAQESRLLNQVSFREGDMNELPFDENTLDWVWSMDLVGYAPVNPLPVIRELARVVKPGGRVTILAWSDEKLLPGYPVLEAHLNATSAGIAPFVKGKKPGSHFLRALGWFREASLEECAVRTFASGAYAPLTDDLRGELTALFKMRWPGVESELSQEDLAAYRRLCRPESPDFMLNHPDYYAFFTYSMFFGRVAV